MDNQKALIEYRGVFNFETISGVVNRIKPAFDACGEKLNTYKKVLIVMLETMENVSKYTRLAFPDEMQDRYSPEIKLLQFPSYYQVTIGNLIRDEDSPTLIEKIELVKQLDKEGLKRRYQQVISDGKFSGQGGAGLGLIEIAKASGNNILYTFEKLHSNYTYFTLYIDIIRN